MNVNKGLEYYSLGDYQKAVSILEKRITEAAPSDRLLLLVSSCYLSLDEFDKSLETLDLISSEDELIISNKLWYMALAYIKLENLDQSRVLLESLIASNSYYHREAKELLSEDLFK